MKRLGCIVWSLLLGLQAWGLEVEAGFYPEELALGETGSYVVSVSGDGVFGGIDLSSVDGLIFEERGVERQIQVVNGRTTSLKRFRYTVIPQRGGEFSVPEYTVGSGKDAVLVPSALLKVHESSHELYSAENAPMGLNLRLPEGPLYVGQLVPVVVELFVDRRLDVAFIDPYPLQEGEYFADKGFLQRPESGSFVAEGVPYVMVRWKSAVLAQKSGVLDLGYSLILGVSEAQTLSGGNSFFGSFLQSNFMTQQERRLQTELMHVEVLPLPQKGRPKGFTGAIGEFQLESAHLDRVDVKQGEPLVLKLSIAGQGNWGRFDAPVLPETPGWKVYPAQANFVPSDPIEATGTWELEYVAIPEEAGSSQVFPEWQFAYWNPLRMRYEVLKGVSEAMDVVAAAPGMPKRASKQTVQDVTDAPVSKPALSAEPSWFVDSELSIDAKPWVPLYRQDRFIWSVGAGFAFFVVLYACIRIRRRRLACAQYRFEHARKSAFLAAMQKAQTAQSKDALAFWQAIREAVQCLAMDVDTLAYHALDMDTVRMRCAECGLDVERCLELYAHADAVRYGGMDSKVERDALRFLEKQWKHLNG